MATRCSPMVWLMLLFAPAVVEAQSGQAGQREEPTLAQEAQRITTELGDLLHAISARADDEFMDSSSNRRKLANLLEDTAEVLEGFAVQVERDVLHTVDRNRLRRKVEDLNQALQSIN